LKVIVNHRETSFAIITESMSDLKRQIVLAIFQAESTNGHAKNKTEAVLNTAVICDIDETTVWSYLREKNKSCKGQYRPPKKNGEVTRTSINR
jgi:hypothetical protein